MQLQMMTSGSQRPAKPPGEIYLIFSVRVNKSRPGGLYALVRLTDERLDWLSAQGDIVLGKYGEFPQQQHQTVWPVDDPGFFMPKVYAYGDRKRERSKREISDRWLSKLREIETDALGLESDWREVKYTGVPTIWKPCVSCHLDITINPGSATDKMIHFNWFGKRKDSLADVVIGTITNGDIPRLKWQVRFG